MNVLESQNFSLSLDERTLIKNLNWSVRAGQVWAILGISGQGKSSLLRALAGLPLARSLGQKGELLWQGKAVHQHSRIERAKQLAWLSQQDFQPFECTVAQRVLAGRFPHGSWMGWESREDLNLMRDALHKVGLSGFEHRVYQSLSGGEQRRVAFAAALVQQASVMLLDEPLSQLDWHHQVDLLKLFETWVEMPDRALVWISHDPNMALRFSTHCLALLPDGGTLQGEVANFKRPEVLARVYDCKVSAVQAESFFFPQ